MPASRSWDETKPAGTDAFRSGDDEIRATKQDVRERVKMGGHIWNAADLAEEGRHAVNAGGAGIGPHIYKADGSTLLLEFPSDVLASLATGWQWKGTGGATTKNMHETVMDDGIVGVDTKGHKRALQGLRIFESTPADTLVNIGRGIYRTSTHLNIAYYGGSTLAIGGGTLPLPGVGNEASYVIVINSGGAVTSRKGTEVAVGVGSATPNCNIGDTILAVIRIQWNSVNFSMATSGNNAYLVNDGRVDQEIAIVKMQVGAETLGFAGSAAGTIRATQILTVYGGIVLLLAVFATTGDVRIDRDGAEVYGSSVIGGGVIIHVDVPTVGPHTYTLRSVGAMSDYRFYVIEIPTGSVL